MPTSPITAKNIAEDLLHRTGDALLENDFNSFAMCFHIPVVIVTINGENKLDKRDDLERTYNQVRAFHKRSNITAIARHSLAAVFSDPNTIKSTHETRLLSGTRLVEEPYPAISDIERINGTWVITRVEYAVPVSARPLNDALGRKGAGSKSDE